MRPARATGGRGWREPGRFGCADRWAGDLRSAYDMRLHEELGVLPREVGAGATRLDDLELRGASGRGVELSDGTTPTRRSSCPTLMPRSPSCGGCARPRAC